MTLPFLHLSDSMVREERYYGFQLTDLNSDTETWRVGKIRQPMLTTPDQLITPLYPGPCPHDYPSDILKLVLLEKKEKMISLLPWQLKQDSGTVPDRFTFISVLKIQFLDFCTRRITFCKLLSETFV